MYSSVVHDLCAIPPPCAKASITFSALLYLVALLFTISEAATIFAGIGMYPGGESAYNGAISPERSCTGWKNLT